MSVDRITLDALPGPALLVDPGSGAVIALNERSARWTSVPPGKGRRLADLLPSDAEALDALVAEAVRVGEASLDHHVRTERTGQRSYWHVRATLAAEGVLLLAVDVTRATTADDCVQAARHQYAGVAAHELRGPLSAIKGWALAGSRPAGDGAGPRADALTVIARQVDRMNGLLTDLLAVAQAEDETLQADLQILPLDSVLRGAVQRSREPARVDVSAGAGAGMRVQVDVLLVELALQNLLSLAAERGGRVELSATRRAREIHVSVASDLGPPSLDHRLLFRSRRRRTRGGKGLAAYVCQQFIARNGGRVWAEADDGPRFVLALPDVDSAGALAPGARGTPARVLVADREPQLLDDVGYVLRRQGFVIESTSSAREVARALARGSFDGLVLGADLQGAEEVGGLRALLQGRQRTAVVVTTPSPSGFPAVEADGAQAVLGVPLDWLHLVSLLRNATAQARG